MRASVRVYSVYTVVQGTLRKHDTNKPDKESQFKFSANIWLAFEVWTRLGQSENFISQGLFRSGGRGRVGERGSQILFLYRFLFQFRFPEIKAYAVFWVFFVFSMWFSVIFRALYECYTHLHSSIPTSNPFIPLSMLPHNRLWLPSRAGGALFIPIYLYLKLCLHIRFCFFFVFSFMAHFPLFPLTFGSFLRLSFASNDILIALLHFFYAFSAFSIVVVVCLTSRVTSLA